MRAELMFSGDELLSGKVVNRNASYLSNELNRMGIRVDRHTSVGDDLKVMVATLQEIGHRKPEVLIISGGLGSTPDDLTVEAVSKATKRNVVFEAEVFTKIAEKLGPEDQRSRDQHRKQAYLPAGSKSFEPVGTAPGFYLQTQSTHVFALPGVPKEMMKMFQRDVIPILVSVGAGEPLKTKKIKTVGLREAEIVNELSDLNWNGSIKINTIASEGEVSLVLSTQVSGSSVEFELERLADIVSKRLGRRIYSVDDESLGEVTAALLKGKGESIAVAESCTGGLIAKMFTDVPGSSAYFRGGIVAYVNQAKTDLLGIEGETIEKHGAVSAEVAISMATSALKKFSAGIGIGVTGIAGPKADDSEKPVGLVYLALAAGDHSEFEEHIFRGDRESVRLQAAMAGVNLVRLHLLGSGPES